MLKRLALLILLFSFLAAAQTTDSDKIWRGFADWIKTRPEITDIRADQYRAKLIESGLSPTQADERMALIGKLYAEHRTEIEPAILNKLYTPKNQQRFTHEPNAFLVSVTKDLKPGKALDIAMGQGRNAVYLATKGWDVTGYDVADEALLLANENATGAGVHINTVPARFETFDYGKQRWDLIYFVYTDAPVIDPKFVATICAALKPGGFLLIERPYRPLTNPDPEWGEEKEHDKPNALTKAWSDLQIVHYEDTTGIGDWQQTSVDRLEKQLRIVRLLARKL